VQTYFRFNKRQITFKVVRINDVADLICTEIPPVVNRLKRILWESAATGKAGQIERHIRA